MLFCILAIAGIDFSTSICIAAPAGFVCSSRTPLSRPVGLRQASAQALTPFLPRDGDARIVYRSPTSAVAVAGAEEPRLKVFERVGDWLQRPVEVVSMQRIAADTVAGFHPSDSFILQIDLSDADLARSAWSPGWEPRRFEVLECVDDEAVAAADFGARISRNTVPVIICMVVAAFAYLLAMSTVRKVRNEDPPLKKVYPSYRILRRISGLQLLNRIHLTANSFNQASVQRLQVALFSFLVGWMLLSLVLRMGVLSDLSVTVVGLLGVSAVGAAISQAATGTKERMGFENWSWLVTKGVLNINYVDEAGPRWRDLVMNGQQFDVYKLQTLIFTLVVAAALIVGGASHLSSFVVPETLLGILGMSQVVYVAGILVRPPSIAELDKGISELRQREQTLRTAIVYGVDVDADGHLPPTLPSRPTNPISTSRDVAAPQARQRYAQAATQLQLMLASTLEIPVDRKRLDPDLTTLETT